MELSEATRLMCRDRVRKASGDGVTAVGVPLDPIDQACFLNSSTRTRVFSL
jgi:hypothetical protein